MLVMAEKRRNSFQTMEDQWPKSNTDCVYFLASPLTCKKRIECEFRHSEIARLNPRDCRYWLSGNCLNPDCAFRHPPLDGPTEGSLDSAHTYQQTAAPMNKSNVPCYFFFNGFCNKGESCLFLHEPTDNANCESTKTVVLSVNRQVIDKKLAVGSEISSGAPLVAHANPSATINKPTIDKRIIIGNGIKSLAPSTTLTNPSAYISRPTIDKKVAMASDINSAAAIITHANPFENYPDVKTAVKNSPPSTLPNGSRQFPNQQSSEPLLKEDKISRLNFPLPSREFTKRTSHTSSEQSSDHRIGNGTDEEEWESSPGFDVQVNQDDTGGFPCQFDKANGGYPYENVDLNLLYPDESIMYEHTQYQSYDHSDIENPSIRANEMPSYMRNRGLDFHPLKEKKTMRTRPASASEDLRDLLKKRRLMNGNYQDRFSSTFRSSESEEKYQHPVLKHSGGRLASQVVVTTGFGSHTERRGFKKSSTQQRIPWLSRRNGPGERFVGRRRGKQTNNSRKSKYFEEFRERRETSSGTTEEEFRGPKSLNEILKEKRMPRSEVSVIMN